MHIFQIKKAVDSKGKIGIEAASKEDIIAAIKNHFTPMDEVKNDISNEILIELGLVGGSTSKVLREELCERLNIGYTNAKQLLNKLNMYNISKERLLDEMTKISKGLKIMIGTPKKTFEILKKHGFTFKKSLGQNFLNRCEYLKIELLMELE